MHHAFEPPALRRVSSLARMNAVVILNPNAGIVGRAASTPGSEEILKVFAAAGIIVDLHIPAAEQIAATFAAVLKHPPDVVFAGGGDGTISTAASYLAGTQIPLAVLPLGTLNHFARDLGLPRSWRDAVAAVAQGVRRSVDLGEVNGRTFINNCSIGSYAEAVRKRDALRRSHGTGKWWAMILATLDVFRRLRRLRARVETAGRVITVRTPFVVVANNRYSGRVLDYSLRPQLDGGELWIYTTRAGRRLDIVRLLVQSLFRKIDQVDHLEKLRVTEAMFSKISGQTAVALDGELAELKWPLHFRIRPAALHVLVPRERSNGE